jgi:hypothetical protein
MTSGAPDGTRQVVTLVIRMWTLGSPGQPQALRLETTLVQTGEIAYFRTVDGLARHIEKLVQRLSAGTAGQPPIDLFRTARRRTERG